MIRDFLVANRTVYLLSGTIILILFIGFLAKFLKPLA